MKKERNHVQWSVRNRRRLHIVHDGCGRPVGDMSESALSFSPRLCPDSEKRYGNIAQLLILNVYEQKVFLESDESYGSRRDGALCHVM